MKYKNYGATNTACYINPHNTNCWQISDQKGTGQYGEQKWKTFLHPLRFLAFKGPQKYFYYKLNLNLLLRR